MLLLVEPHHPVRYVDMTVGRALVRRNVESRSLDTLEWETTDDYQPSEVLPAALRRGIKTGRGLIVDEGFVKTFISADVLEDARAQQRALQDELASVRRTGNQPAYEQARRHQAEIDERADSTREATLKAAVAAKQEFVAEPIKDELQQHWIAVTQRPVETYPEPSNHD
ncbi:hypothetical protein [Auritidibacter ignavus]|uniref:hypothetical protein n=1 Tax=Auritidibacter ignavus TaxID=678932 RepID=UPI00109C28AD|nr:hypothetical protein [Auritidibacter ignavus]